jgi:hypothetical protein
MSDRLPTWAHYALPSMGALLLTISVGCFTSLDRRVEAISESDNKQTTDIEVVKTLLEEVRKDVKEVKDAVVVVPGSAASHR